MTRLTILHTNDLHGRLHPLVRIAALAKTIRREVETGGGYCALWDAGDAEDTTLFESSITRGSAVMAMLHGAGYELEALGNASPLRYGPQCVSDLAAQFGQPLLCANMIDPQTQAVVEGLAPFVIRRYGEVTVGIIGLTDPMASYQLFKLIMPAPHDILPSLIDEVRAQGAQTIIVLSHCGSKKDQALAETVKGIDLIIGAHDHQIIDPPLVVNGTLIVQAGDFGCFLGRLDLELDPITGRIVAHHGALIPIGDDLPIDEDAQAAIDRQRARVQTITARVIGRSTTPLDLAHDRPSPAGQLLAEALLDRMQGEIAVALSGQWTTGLPAGEITVGALYAANRSSANPGRARLTGERILHFLREAMRPDNRSRTPKGLRGVPIGWPSVAGLRLQFDPTVPDGFVAYVGSQPLQLDRTYVVAATDLEFSDIIGYLNLSDSEVGYELPTIMPEVLEDYIATHSPLNVAV
ncbi:MAG TPA: 5'-nucleotidase C-terminal domain-containing protein [Anaerolineae bacterium]|nr:5'-nucleotidase C-terminal domain-containing protein [Anaerolineae bacterium]